MGMDANILPKAFRLLVALLIITAVLTVALLYQVTKPVTCNKEHVVASEPTYCEHPVGACDKYAKEIDRWIKAHDKMYDMYEACTCDLAECQSVLYEDIMSVRPECIR